MKGHINFFFISPVTYLHVKCKKPKKLIDWCFMPYQQYFGEIIAHAQCSVDEKK
jgi:hypothetical protein